MRIGWCLLCFALFQGGQVDMEGAGRGGVWTNDPLREVNGKKVKCAGGEGELGEGFAIVWRCEVFTLITSDMQRFGSDAG